MCPSSLTTAADQDQIWLTKNATQLNAASTPATWDIIPGASHHMCNDHTTLKAVKKCVQPIVIDLGDDNKGTVRHHGLVNVSLRYKVNTPCTPRFRLSLDFINQW